MARLMKDSGIPWIGEIPVDWETPKMAAICSTITDFVASGSFASLAENVEYLDEPDYAMLIRTTDISGKGNKPKPVYINKHAYDFLNNSNLYGGELVFPNIGAVGDVYIVPVLYKRMSLAPNAIMVRANNCERFLYYYFLSKPGRLSIEDISQTTAQAKFNKTNFRQLKVLLPSEKERSRIANFLDAECARIDAIIEQTRATVDEYKKLKQAIITQAVTKGIRPNRPMKDSGIEWIGEIPEDWDVRRIKTIFKLRDERNYLPLEEVNLISLYTDLGVVQHSDLEKTTGNKATNADGYKKVYENDIIVNIILCWMGAIGRSAYSGVTSPAYDIYVPSDEVESRFYHHYFRTNGFSGDCYKRGRGIMAMRWRTYSDQFMDIKVVVPPVLEQREILSRLDGLTAGIDQIIEKKERLLSEIENYKKSLIYEYVTGKKEMC